MRLDSCSEAVLMKLISEAVVTHGTLHINNIYKLSGISEIK